MARKPAGRPTSAIPSIENIVSVAETVIDPYTTLGIHKSATADQIKSAYRKAALKSHPDKALPEEKEDANKRFQQVTFAHAILSDPRRRKRYDSTGNTAESLDVDDEEFDWVDYFREQTAAMVDGAMIERIKNEYQGSDEERQDVLRVYMEYEGDMDALYEEIMCSSVLDDENRFRTYVDTAIAKGEVESFPAYVKESKAKKRRRVERARGEAEEAMQLAEELGVKDNLFGSGKKSKSKKEDDQAGLMALIQQRQKDRSETFLDRLEAKYGGGTGTKKQKRKVEEPPEHLFHANSKKARASR